MIDILCFSTKSALKDVLEDAVFSEDGIQSRHYQLMAGDLREMKLLGDRILSRGIDTRWVHLANPLFPSFYSSSRSSSFVLFPSFPSLPTMILTECVLVYMEPDKSENIVRWFGENFHTALFLNYEPVCTALCMSHSL